MDPPGSRPTERAAATRRAQAAFFGLALRDPTFRKCLDGEITLNNVLETLRQKSGNHKRKKSTRLLERFHQCTAWMLNIAGSIDVAVNASAGIACPVWAPVKFLLMTVQRDMVAAESILDVVQMLSDNLPRIDLYQQLHKDARFDTALIILFADITDFCNRAYEFFNRRSAIRLGFLLRKNFNDHFGAVISAIGRRTRAIDNLAGALTQEKLERHIDENKDRSRQEDRIRAMQWLQASNVQDSHHRNLSVITDSTCEWILSDPNYSSWIDHRGSCGSERLLVIHGPPGCGKSVLASFLFNMPPTAEETTRIEGGNLTGSARNHLFFSFSADDSNRRTLSNMVRTILAQMLAEDHQCSLIPIFQRCMGQSPMSTNAMLEVLHEALNTNATEVTLIVDGIDECTDERSDVFKYLSDICYRNPRLKLIVLGQSHIFSSFLDSTPDAARICIGPETNRKDIEIIVRKEVATFASLWSEAVVESISQTLLSRAHGMILWVRLMVKFLQTASCEEELLQSLVDIPHGLDQSYYLLLNRLSGRLNRHQQKFVHTILSLLSSCGRPIIYEELRHLYALATEPSEIDDPLESEKFLLRTPPEDIANTCGGFVVYQDRHFFLVHNSARAFLTRPESDWNSYDTSLKSFRVDFTATQCQLGSLCLKVLKKVGKASREGDSERGNNNAVYRSPLQEYAGTYFAYHLNRSDRPKGVLRTMMVDAATSGGFNQIFSSNLIHGVDNTSHLHLELWILWERLWPEAWASTENESFDGISPLSINHWQRPSTSAAGIQFRPGAECQTHDDFVQWLSHEMKSEVVNEELARQEELLLGVHEPSQETSVLRSFLRDNRASVNSHVVEALSLTPTVNTALPLHHYSLVLGRRFDTGFQLIHSWISKNSELKLTESLLGAVRRMVQTLPTTLLSAITYYYHGLHKDDEAFEIGNICSKRLEGTSSFLRFVHEHMMGYVSLRVGKYRPAAAHLTYALSNLPKFTIPGAAIYQRDSIRLAYCYCRLNQWKHAINILEKVTQIKLSAEEQAESYGLLLRCYLLLMQYDNAYMATLRNADACASFCPLTGPQDGLKRYIRKMSGEMQCLAAVTFFERRQDRRSLQTFERLPQFFGTDNHKFMASRSAYCRIIRDTAQVMALGGTERLQDHIKKVCKDLGSEHCLGTLDSRFDACMKILDSNPFTLRVWNEYHEYHKAYRRAHRNLTLHECHLYDEAYGCLYSYQLYNKSGNEWGAIRGLWKCIDIYDQDAQSTDRGKRQRGLVEVLVRLSECYLKMDKKCDMTTEAVYAARLAIYLMLDLDPIWCSQELEQQVHQQLIACYRRMWLDQDPPNNEELNDENDDNHALKVFFDANDEDDESDEGCYESATESHYGRDDDDDRSDFSTDRDYHYEYRRIEDFIEIFQNHKTTVVQRKAFATSYRSLQALLNPEDFDHVCSAFLLIPGQEKDVQTCPYL